MLHWIAAARARLVPDATRPDSLLLDLACGGGLLAPHVAGRGHRHVGLDLSAAGLPHARAHGVVPVRGDVLRLPFADAVADVVVAGEVLEHVTEPLELLSEACRVLRPGGVLVLDTIAATRWGRFLSITVGERIPAGPPPRLHDPALFVDRLRAGRRRPQVRRGAAAHGPAGERARLPGLARGQEVRGAHAADPVHRRAVPGLRTQDVTALPVPTAPTPRRTPRMWLARA